MTRTQQTAQVAQPRLQERLHSRLWYLESQINEAAFVLGAFEDANLVAIHAKRVTVMSKDFKLGLRIKRVGW